MAERKQNKHAADWLLQGGWQNDVVYHHLLFLKLELDHEEKKKLHYEVIKQVHQSYVSTLRH